MLYISFSRDKEKFDLKFDDGHSPSQLLMECFGLFKIEGQCGVPRIDDSHAPFGVAGCLDLDIDLDRF